MFLISEFPEIVIEWNWQSFVIVFILSDLSNLLE